MDRACEAGTKNSLGQSVTALNRIIDRLELEAVDIIKVHYVKFVYKRLAINSFIFPCFSNITLYRYFSLGNTIHALSGSERACRGRKSQIRLLGHQTEDRSFVSFVTSRGGKMFGNQFAPTTSEDLTFYNLHLKKIYCTCTCRRGLS